MSSPKALSRAPVKGKTDGAKPAVGKTVASKPSAKKPAKAAVSDDASPTPAQKAAFLKAMAAGVKLNTAASRSLVKKKGSPFAAEAPKPTPKVEVLRRIPAPVKVVDTPESKTALALAALIEASIDARELGKVQPHAQQALVAALCKLYAAHAEAGERFDILGQRAATVAATDVMVMCGALLKAVDLQVFELGMWQSWSSG
jgi:hypothetical protein